MTNNPTEVSDTTNAAEAATTETQAPAADLGLQDLVALKTIVDVASSRGVFKPNEMVAVGTVYSKLEKFLETAQKQSQQAAPAPTQEQTNV